MQPLDENGRERCSAGSQTSVNNPETRISRWDESRLLEFSRRLEEFRSIRFDECRSIYERQVSTLSPFERFCDIFPDIALPLLVNEEDLNVLLKWRLVSKTFFCLATRTVNGFHPFDALTVGLNYSQLRIKSNVGLFFNSLLGPAFSIDPSISDQLQFARGNKVGINIVFSIKNLIDESLKLQSRLNEFSRITQKISLKINNEEELIQLDNLLPEWTGNENDMPDEQTLNKLSVLSKINELDLYEVEIKNNIDKLLKKISNENSSLYRVEVLKFGNCTKIWYSLSTYYYKLPNLIKLYFRDIHPCASITVDNLPKLTALSCGNMISRMSFDETDEFHSTANITNLPQLKLLKFGDLDVFADVYLRDLPELTILKFGHIRNEIRIRDFPNLKRLEFGNIEAFPSDLLHKISVRELRLGILPQLQTLSFGNINRNIDYALKSINLPELTTLAFGDINVDLVIGDFPKLTELKFKNICANIIFVNRRLLDLIDDNQRNKLLIEEPAQDNSVICRPKGGCVIF